MKRDIQQQLVHFVEKDIMLRRGGSWAINCESPCTHVAKQLFTLLHRLEKTGVWPVGEWLYHPVSIVTVLGRFRSCDFTLSAPGPCSPGCVGARTSSFANVQKAYSMKAKEVEQSVPRLCYHCVCEGRELGDISCSHDGGRKST